MKLSMALSLSSPTPSITRRRFLATGLASLAGLLVYSGEIERHWIEVTEHEVFLRGLPQAFAGMRVVQLSDIHLDNFTEPSFLRRAVERINELKPDAVFLTGDYVTAGHWSKMFHNFPVHHCAVMLNNLECTERYAILGNHDVGVGTKLVTDALTEFGTIVLRNQCVPLQRAGSTLWLAGVDDPLVGHPDLDLAIPPSIRNLPSQPVVLLSHAPDYADRVLAHPAAQSVALMLSGHSHGGQVRLPFIGPLVLPTMARKYSKGWYRLDAMQLYVNRGLGTIGIPFRLDCPPEISVFTLRQQA